MKLFFLAILAHVCMVNDLLSQDTSALIREVKDKLKEAQLTVSDVLISEKYLVLHPQTSFRELISKYSSTGSLKITPENEPGKKIKVTGTITDSDGRPVSGALIYLYQTDSRGWYAADAPHVLGYEGDLLHAHLFGYVLTNKEGKFELHTVKPQGYPRSDLPAHIHIHVTAKGFQSYGTEFLFDDDERLTAEIRTRALRDGFLISLPAASSKPFEQQFSYTIKLRKN